MSLRSTAVLGSTLLLLVACGQTVTESMIEDAIEDENGGEADVDMRGDGSMRIETEEGTFSTGGDMPEGWPEDAPAYPGATVGFGGEATNTADGENGMVVMLTTDAAAADVVAFYKAAFTEHGWTTDMMMEGQGSSLLTAKKDGRIFGLAITDQAGQTSISMTMQVGE